MGLLDDAIRDHLDLKRRRGGDPAEIERAEREALGPVRRTPDPLIDVLSETDDETALYDDAAPVGGPVSDAPGVPVFDEAYDDEDDLLAEDDDEWLEEDEHPPLTFAAPPQGAAAPPPPAEPVPAPVAPPPPSPAPPPVAAPEPPRSSEPAPPQAEPHPVPGVGDETVEYRVEDALATGEPATDEEDVLEETPEFLQDTPEHDRLWFEQRPPRDFDFDG
jgi:hypothetical protein